MKFLLSAAVAAALLTCGCQSSHTVKIEPVEIKPIHITMDINIKVDREVDSFFDQVEQKAAEKGQSAEVGTSTGGAK
jgi:hypothetical protein